MTMLVMMMVVAIIDNADEDDETDFDDGMLFNPVIIKDSSSTMNHSNYFCPKSEPYPDWFSLLRD